MEKTKTKKLKILNAYCGIGGNRKLWGNKHEVTAIENNPEIQKIHGIDLSKYKLKDKRQILRNCVVPELGLHILNESQKKTQLTL